MLAPATAPPKLATLVAMASISAMSINLFLPSLSRMAVHFGADYAVMQLAVSGYLGVTGLLQLIVGPLSDRYGRRPVTLVAVAIFVLATLGCLAARDATTFLVFRMLQGAVVTAMALSRAIVRDLVPPAEAASMIGYVTMAMALVPMVGPTIGGVLDEAFGWQAAFVLLAVAGTFVFILCWVDLGETNRARSTSLTAQFRAYPELFRSRRFWGYALSAAFASGAFFSFLGGAPYVAETAFGLSPVVLGLYIGCVPLGFALGNFLSGRYARRFGLTAMMTTGTLIACTGLSLMALLFLAGFEHPAVLFGLTASVGVSNGLTLPSATAGSLSVRPHLAGSAAGLSGALMVGGGALLAAITGALLTPESGAWPLILTMLGSSVAAFLAVLYVRRIDAREGPLA
jgi:DHA1 family bicyclomycin/chloramphenicol resistance-like MFS transporter